LTLTFELHRFSTRGISQDNIFTKFLALLYSYNGFAKLIFNILLNIILLLTYYSSDHDAVYTVVSISLVVILVCL